MASATGAAGLRAALYTSTTAVCLVLAFPIGMIAGQSAQDRAVRPSVDANLKRPKLTLKADTLFSISSSRVRFTAHLEGGADDDQEFYCPKIVWEWSDGTRSESTFDCKPYERGQTEITRYFTVDHVFVAGDHRVKVRLLTSRGKEVASAGTNFIIR